ncbi:MAG: hypothetical protein PHX10_07320 [Gallionellaceae bacterium]|nr:hypothetical protein [Gallionellaceae bacterium]
MSAISKTVKTFALLAALSAGSAMAGPGGCMPMAMPMQMPMMPMSMMQGGSGCGNSGAQLDSQQACQVREANASQEAGCNGNGQDLSSRMGSMAAGGMNIAMTVIGSIFGSPAR